MKNLNPRISAIVAMSENRVIGNANRLPWHLPADLKHFKQITTGHPIIMGRKTFESIGKPLPNRTNIVISRDQHFKPQMTIVVSSIEEAIKEAAKSTNDEIFIIGGAQIFEQSLALVNRIYLTIIHEDFMGNILFPELPKTEWKEIDRDFHGKDAENHYDYSFLILERA